MTKRPGSMSDDDRALGHTRHRGVQIAPSAWDGTDQLTPVSGVLPDEIEIAAARIEQRAEAIRDRPGPTPPPEALQSAITIHGVRTELHGFVKDVKQEFLTVHQKVDKVAGVVLEGMAAELDRRRDTDHLVYRQQTQIGTASDIAQVEVAAAREKTAEVKKRNRAETRSKIAVFLLSAATFVMALLEARHC